MEFEFDLSEFESELKTFEEEQRPLFPPLGMTWSVDECPNCTYLRRYGQLLQHWIDIHKDKRKLAKCKSCKKCFKTKASARKHVSASHRKNNVDGLLVNIMVNNRSYISPGNTPLPRKMTQIEERVRKREEEKEKRKQLLEECERNTLLMKKELPEPMRLWIVMKWWFSMIMAMLNVWGCPWKRNKNI